MNSKTEQINLTLINMWISYKAMLPHVRNYISPSLKDLSLTHSPPKQHFEKITCKHLQPVIEIPPVASIEEVPIIEVKAIAPIEEVPIKEEPVIEAKPESNKSLQQIDNNKSLKQIDKNIITNLHKLVIGILLFIVIILLYFLSNSQQKNNNIIKTSSLPVISTTKIQNSGGISNEETERLRREREKMSASHLLNRSLSENRWWIIDIPFQIFDSLINT